MRGIPTIEWVGGFRFAVALTALLGGAGAVAADRPPNIGSTLREIEQQRPAVPPRASTSLQVEQSARPAMSTAAGATFRVSSVRISGASMFSDVELLTLIDGLAGREVTLADLERAASRITQFYRGRGFPVARAYVPAQTITGGSVEIAVLEGRYGALDIRNTSRLSNSLLHSTLRAPAEDAVIESVPLDRDLLLLNGLAGVATTATLTPGERVGTADLVVDVAPLPTYSGTLEADNYGNRYTGQWRYGGSVAAANLAGRGDLLSVRGLLSQDTGLWYGRAAYQVPVSGNGLRVGAALSHTYYSLGERFSSLDADGTADIYTLFSQYPMVRRTRGSLDAQVAFNYFDLDDQIDAVNTNNPRQLRSVTLSVTGNFDDDVLGGGVSAGSVAIGTGNLQFDNDAAEQIDRATARTRGDFDTVLYSALRLQRISDALHLYVALQGQYASKNLDSSQKFVLGGPNAVRAYAQGDGVGDEGLLGTAELRYSLPSRGWLAHPQLFTFIDAGSIHINAQPYLPTTNQIDLYGAGVGFSADMWSGLTLRGSIAWRIGSDSGVDETNSNSQSWITLVKAF